ncbi:acyl-CoA thioesterase [Agarivorans sp. TSD2052]|uniref:acyl-CoA thioesterase n=1 Tax=Agarivorans sp. TSD2052 TaxID=2937286 RepID=UPI00200D032F|nr:acyl-CoA thioesterase [Agarivorans sp. TSD2052]UPW19346.1 acyl-CoA thioesterase [Agarivorans sp. TSD2052]
MKALLSAEVEVTVPFHDADPMGVTWHGNYLRYFEVARCALLVKLDFSYRQMEQSGYLWPIVDARVKYVKTSTYEQRLTVQAHLVEFENRLKIEYNILEQENGDVVTKGFTIQVAVDSNKGEMCFVSPPALIERLAKLGICAQD